MAYLAASVIVMVLERLRLTRHIWHLPLFFRAIVLFFSVIGLISSMKDGYKQAITIVVVALALAAAYLLSTATASRPGRAIPGSGGQRRHCATVLRPVVQSRSRTTSLSEGDLFFEIDPSPYRVAVGNASAKVQQAEAQALEAQPNFKRRRTFTKPRSSATGLPERPGRILFRQRGRGSGSKPDSRPPNSTFAIRKSTHPWMATSRM